MRVALALTFVALTASTALAAKTTRFWNLTDNTITSLALAPTGTDKFGADQAKNDKDGTVEHDERLKIIDTPPGVYDVRFTDNKGRTCTVKAVTVKEGDVFPIDEKQLAGCKK